MLNSAEILHKLLPISKNKIEYIGDILQYLLPWGALLGVALEGNIPMAQRWLYAGLATSILTHILKFLFNFTPLGTRPDGGKNSFPSGHTSTAFMGAAFFHLHWGIALAIVPYLLAAFTGYSRIYAQKHWLRDVIAGAALAISIVFLL